jgi:hypothetical protein
MRNEFRKRHAALRPKRQSLEDQNKHGLNLLREVGTQCERPVIV